MISSRRKKEESSREGSGTDLDADSLVEVFSHLSHKDLLEVMLVNKLWEKTALEADSLWEKVEVFHKWDMRDVGVEGVGAEGPSHLFQVL